MSWSIAVVLLGNAAAAAAQDAGIDPRLLEAQANLEEAKRFLDAGRYADGLPYGERGLTLQEAVLGGCTSGCRQIPEPGG